MEKKKALLERRKYDIEVDIMAGIGKSVAGHDGTRHPVLVDTPMRTYRPTFAKIGVFGGLEVYAELGYGYPTGSIKYRIACSMIDDAERRGQLHRGMEIVERSSGNTGIALAYEGTRRDYHVRIFAGREVTADAKRMMHNNGATVVPFDGYFSECGPAIKKLIEADPDLYYWPDQINNPVSLQSNVGLGKEIAGDLVPDVFVASSGTGSTITGIGSALKMANPNLQVYLVTPEDEFSVPGIDDPFLYDLPLFHRDIVNWRILIREEDAIESAQRLYLYGHPVGVSGGAVFAAAERLGQEHDGKAVIIFPDHRNRYRHLLGE